MPHNPFVTFRLPKLPTALESNADLLAHLGVTDREINLIAARKHSQYTIFSRKKRKGGLRTVSSPNSRLKYLQRLIAELLSEIYRPRNSVHGFVSGRSALSNASAHLGRRHLVKLDLTNFFGQISSRRVKGLFQSIGIKKDVSDTLIKLCLLANSLPQGAPTSPIISNMIAFRLDNTLLRYAKENRLHYTRYADDIVLSSHGHPKALAAKHENHYAKLKESDLALPLSKIIFDEDFEINADKIYYMGPNSRRAVTGYTINEFANVPRRHVRRVRATLHNIEKNGYGLEQIKFSKLTHSIKSLRKSLRGQIEWIGATKGLSDPVYRTYAMEYNRVLASDMKIGPDLNMMAELSTWIIECYRKTDGMPMSQGSVFFLQGFGLTTAAHCLTDNCNYFIFSATQTAVKYPVAIEKLDAHIDLAKLSHTIPNDKYLELPRSNGTLHVGEEVQIWGFPAFGPGHKITKKIGRIIGTPTIRAVPMYAFDQKIYGGNSGGPVLDKAGRVIGVCHKGGEGEAHDLAVQQVMLDRI